MDPLPKQDLKSLGEMLRLRRQERQLSLKEVENATSIRTPYLNALEEGDMQKLISPIYAQGFFRQYAAFLGIDGERLVREHPTLFHRADSQEFAYGIGTLEGRGNPGSGVKWFPNLLWIGAFFLVGVVAWYLAEYLGLIV